MSDYMPLEQSREASGASRRTQGTRRKFSMRHSMLASAAITATALALAPTALATIADTGDSAGAASSDAPTAAESVKALQEATPEVLRDAPQPAAEPPAAEQQAIRDVTTKIASDPAAGFSVDTPDTEPLKIKPVGVESSAKDVKTIAGGELAVATGTDPGVSTIIKPEEGGISTYTVISGSESPERYTWDVGDGKTILVHDDGHATVQNQSGEVVAQVPAPYAKTSDGVRLQDVRFEADGSRLTLVVPHRSQVTDYGTGVIADPLWTVPMLVWAGHKVYRAGQSAYYVCVRYCHRVRHVWNAWEAINKARYVYCHVRGQANCQL